MFIFHISELFTVSDDTLILCYQRNIINKTNYVVGILRDNNEKGKTFTLFYWDFPIRLTTSSVSINHGLVYPFGVN